MKILLASESPRRINLMRALGLTFETVKPREPPCPLYSADPAQMAERLAVFKALQFKGEGIVVAADTLVAKEGKIYPKPSTREEAVRILRELRGGTHEVITGVAVVYSDHLLVSRERTIVVMRNFSDQELLRYVESGAPMDKAGAYGIQDEFRPVHSFEGCYQNVVGLPLCLLRRLLVEFSVKVQVTIPEECWACARVSELRRH
jgi:MAF protein